MEFAGFGKTGLGKRVVHSSSSTSSTPSTAFNNNTATNDGGQTFTRSIPSNFNSRQRSLWFRLLLSPRDRRPREDFFRFEHGCGLLGFVSLEGGYG